MGIGLGIVLLLIGLILVLDVIPGLNNLPIDSSALGWIFVVVGALAIVLALVMNKQRSETKHIEERRYDGGSGPRY